MIDRSVGQPRMTRGSYVITRKERVMEQVRVSLIVPIYNMEQYLEQCIISLLDQTYKNIEIILVNDGSTDSSPSICKKYSEKDSRVLYIDQENQGVSVARNKGLDCATGQWVSFVDSDDWAAPDMISALLEKSEGSDMVVGNFYIAQGDKLIYSSFFNSSITDEQKKSPLYLIGNALGSVRYGAVKYCNIGVPWAKMYRRNFLVENKLEFPVGIRRMQDMIFNIDVFSNGPRIAFLDFPVYYYRIVDSSACRRYDPRYGEVAQQILSAIEKPIKNSLVPEIQGLYYFKQVSLIIENISIFYGHAQCPLSYMEKREGIKRLCTSPSNAVALKHCDIGLFFPKQRITLYLLSVHMYFIVCLLYDLKNRRKIRHNVQKC